MKKVDLPLAYVEQIQRMAIDRASGQLRSYPCPHCKGNMSLVIWHCGSCGRKNEKPDILDNPIGAIRDLFRKNKPLVTPATGCGDKYCINPVQNAMQCPRCDTVLIFDTAKFNEAPVVAEPAPTLSIEEALQGMVELHEQVQTHLEDGEHKQAMRQAKRENEIQSARIIGGRPSDESDWVKKTFKDRGFGQ